MSMNEKTLAALNESIIKWQKRAAGEISVPSVSACPLCSLFYEDHCDGCPVSEKTGMECCLGTPVGDYQELIDDEDDNSTVEQLKHTAAEEVEFLQSLLPVGEQP